MKKTIALILALSLCLAMLIGCAKKEETQTATLANPVKTYKSIDEQAAAVGIGLEAPEGAEDISYQSIQSMAETAFTLDGVEYRYRAEPTDKTEAYDISGLYYEMTKTDATVQGREATLLSCKEAAAVLWLDVAAGVNYCLSCTGAVEADALIALAEAVYVPLQGEV